MSDSVKDFRKGERVQLHPSLDRWMKGDRYGEVVSLGTLYVHVRLDKSGRLLPFRPGNLIHLEDSNV